VFAGDALSLAQEKLAPVLADRFIIPSINRTLPNPEDVALLARARAAEGEFDNLMALEPHYVRQTYTQRQ
jgi:hypothetical protein